MSPKVVSISRHSHRPSSPDTSIAPANIAFLPFSLSRRIENATLSADIRGPQSIDEAKPGKFCMVFLVSQTVNHCTSSFTKQAACPVKTLFFAKSDTQHAVTGRLRALRSTTLRPRLTHKFIDLHIYSLVLESNVQHCSPSSTRNQSSSNR